MRGGGGEERGGGERKEEGEAGWRDGGKSYQLHTDNGEQLKMLASMSEAGYSGTMKTLNPNLVS